MQQLRAKKMPRPRSDCSSRVVREPAACRGRGGVRLAGRGVRFAADQPLAFAERALTSC